MWGLQKEEIGLKKLAGEASFSCQPAVLSYRYLYVLDNR